MENLQNNTNQDFYFAVYDKEDTYKDRECLDVFDTEDEARDFVISDFIIKLNNYKQLKI